MASALKIFLLGLAALGIFLPEFLPSTPRPRAFNRIICLSPAETQNLAYLGLEGKIIALSPYDTHPIASSLPRIPGVNASDEEILSLRPDLILVSETRAFDHLEQRGIKVHVSQTGGLRAVYSNLKILESLFDLNSNRSETFLHKISTPKGAYLGSYVIALGIEPLYSVSTNTFFSEIMSLAGWENAVQTLSAYPVLNAETLARLRGDIVFVPMELSKETQALENIRRRIGAKKVLILSNQGIFLPSPFLPDEIAALQKLRP